MDGSTHLLVAWTLAGMLAAQAGVALFLMRSPQRTLATLQQGALAQVALAPAAPWLAAVTVRVSHEAGQTTLLGGLDPVPLAVLATLLLAFATSGAALGRRRPLEGPAGPVVNLVLLALSLGALARLAGVDGATARVLAYAGRDGGLTPHAFTTLLALTALAGSTLLLLHGRFTAALCRADPGDPWLVTLQVLAGACSAVTVAVTGAFCALGLLVTPAVVAAQLTRRVAPMFGLASAMGALGGLVCAVAGRALGTPAGLLGALVSALVLAAYIPRMTSGVPDTVKS